MPEELDNLDNEAQRDDDASGNGEPSDQNDSGEQPDLDRMAEKFLDQDGRLNVPRLLKSYNELERVHTEKAQKAALWDEFGPEIKELLDSRLSGEKGDGKAPEVAKTLTPTEIKAKVHELVEAVKDPIEAISEVMMGEVEKRAVAAPAAQTKLAQTYALVFEKFADDVPDAKDYEDAMRSELRRHPAIMPNPENANPRTIRDALETLYTLAKSRGTGAPRSGRSGGTVDVGRGTGRLSQQSKGGPPETNKEAVAAFNEALQTSVGRDRAFANALMAYRKARRESSG